MQFALISPTQSCWHPARAYRTRFESLGLAMFVLYFCVYVASNASTTFEASDSPAKHLIMVAAAVLSIVMRPVRSLRSALLFAPLAIIYLLGNLPGYALMAIAFSAALPILGAGMRSIFAQRRIQIIGFLALVALMPTLVSWATLGVDSLVTTYYGRPRLLLGYWHPKEAAASLAVPFLLYLIMQRRKLPGIALALLPAFLMLVGSRNVALALYLAIGVCFYPRLTRYAIVILLLGAVAFVLTASDSYDVFDELLSLRFSVWSEALGDLMQLNSTDLIGGDRLSIDSYYVEILLSAGITGLLLFAGWAIFFYVRCVRPFTDSRWRVAMFAAILFFAAFDSGIVSTGNVFHVVAWTLVTMPLATGTNGWRHRRRRTPGRGQHDPLRSRNPHETSVDLVRRRGT